MNIKVGILGPGSIAHKMADTISKVSGFSNYAVASRDLNRAIAFQKKFGFTKAYGNYEELLQDNSVDLVYVALPHSLHYEYLKLCLKYHKHVLCEKILTCSSRESKDILEEFKKNNLILVEALWTSFMPFNADLHDIFFDKHLIGTLTKVYTSFQIPIFHIKRIRERELGGGAAMDLGVYPISFIFRTLGFDYQSLLILKNKFRNGVDVDNKICFKYNDNLQAFAKFSCVKLRPNSVRIKGSKGSVFIDSITCPTVIKVFNKRHKLIKKVCYDIKYGGFEYELHEIYRLISKGKIESSFWTSTDVLRVAEVVDKLI